MDVHHTIELAPIQYPSIDSFRSTRTNAIAVRLRGFWLDRRKEQEVIDDGVKAGGQGAMEASRTVCHEALLRHLYVYPVLRRCHLHFESILESTG